MVVLFSSAHEGYAPLSNFWPCEVELDGEVYKSLEHAYQAAKFLDPGLRRKVGQAATAAKARKLGRRYNQHKRLDWFTTNLAVMEMLCWRKFSRCSVALEVLLSTGTERLEEDTRDRFWGGKGCNHMGNILMLIRGHW